ncbi:type I-E CRISPR-associated endonuclease Cas1e [Acinetobacter ursingii]|uniref:type I-E CRISPR-associated endonuclease Cas1e n=1 Tax=Acinetobacter ursingii TaxID=108980 RepID=UPI00254B8BE2|nr:type I-E CRISPR-associated endonuclease Cas1e [Acinetobacter ursingii]MEC6128192.1 type I-E CRISPR-associated endonuclease Cas1e [Acinetobacter ursingii]
MSNKLFIKLTRETLPQIKEKFPFIYLEAGRLEVDDSSVKWIDSTGNVVRLPIATISALLLGFGTTVTHAAVKACASANCTLCWVGEDSLLFYASGMSPTSNTRNFKKQMLLAADKTKSLSVARNMFNFRFPETDTENKTLKELMGMEGYRVKKLYADMAEKYQVGWKGRSYTPNNFELSDTTNKILTSANAALYAVISSVVFSLGYSPYIGFVHSGSPLPFIYDLADLYKEILTIDMAFSLTKDMASYYDKYILLHEFRKRIIETRLLENLADDIHKILTVK